MELGNPLHLLKSSNPTATGTTQYSQSGTYKSMAPGENPSTVHSARAVDNNETDLDLVDGSISVREIKEGNTKILEDLSENRKFCDELKLMMAKILKKSHKRKITTLRNSSRQIKRRRQIHSQQQICEHPASDNDDNIAEIDDGADTVANNTEKGDSENIMSSSDVDNEVAQLNATSKLCKDGECPEDNLPSSIAGVKQDVAKLNRIFKTIEKRINKSLEQHENKERDSAVIEHNYRDTRKHKTLLLSKRVVKVVKYPLMAMVGTLGSLIVLKSMLAESHYSQNVTMLLSSVIYTAVQRVANNFLQ